MPWWCRLITSTDRPQPSRAAATEPAEVPTATSTSRASKPASRLERGERAEQPGEPEHAAAAEHEGAARPVRAHVRLPRGERPAGARPRPALATSGIAARVSAASLAVSSSASDAVSACATVSMSGIGVPVGVDAEEHAAVVGAERDRQRLTLVQRQDREHLGHPRAGGVQRELRSRHVRDGEAEHAPGQTVRRPSAERVQRRRSEPAQPDQRIGAHRRGGGRCAQRCAYCTWARRRSGSASPTGRSTSSGGHPAGPRPALRRGVADVHTHRHERAHRGRGAQRLAPRACSQLRSAPVTTARTTSFTVPPRTRADRAVVVQPGAGDREPPLLAELGVQRRAPWRSPRAGHRTAPRRGHPAQRPGDPPRGRPGVAHRQPHGVGQLRRPLHHPGERVGDQPGGRRLADRASRSPRRCAAARATRPAAPAVMSMPACPSTIDVVRLRDDRDPPAGEAFDEVHLPQRAVPVEQPGLDAPAELEQRRVVARTRQRRASHVVGDVEVRVVDPHRVGEIAGHGAQLLPVPRRERDPLLEQPHQPVVVEARSAPRGSPGRRHAGASCAASR